MLCNLADSASESLLSIITLLQDCDGGLKEISNKADLGRSPPHNAWLLSLIVFQSCKMAIIGSKEYQTKADLVTTIQYNTWLLFPYHSPAKPAIHTVNFIRFPSGHPMKLEQFLLLLGKSIINLFYKMLQYVLFIRLLRY